MILEAVRERDSEEHSMGLRKFFSALEKTGCSLFLAENDPALMRSLSRSLDDSESVLAISRGNWRQEVESLLGELLGQRDFQNKLSLVILGSSGDQAAKATGVEGKSGFEKWLDGARQCQHHFEESKQRFGKMVRELQSWNGGDSDKPPHIQLQALFFHATVGVFLVYDWERDAFSPLQAG